MANPNSAVWGAPETWQFAKWLYNVGGYNPTDKKAGRPKCANFSDGGDTSASLNAGNTAGKTPINTPLDKTICPCGQDAAVSVFGKIALFKNKQNAQQNIIPDKVIERSDPINWAFYTNNTGANPKQLRDRGNSTQRWSPNASVSNNDNGNINPLVYYQSRSLFAKIYVRAWSGWNSQYPDSPTGGRNMSLNEWKTNYSSYFITDVWLELCGISGISGDTYSYGAGQSSGHGFGVAQLDDIDGIYDYADSTYPVDQFIYLFRNLSGNYNNLTSTMYLPAYGEFENEVIKSFVYYSWELTRAIPYSANNYEKIMKMVACFGVPFSDKNISQFTYLSSDLYLPIIDDNGITHGEYTHGNDNTANDFYGLDSVRDKDYDPSKPIDPNTYSNTTSFNSISGGASMTKRYVLDKANTDILADDLWTISSALATVQGNDDYDHYEAKVIDNFLVTNPIDCIVSLKRFPFDIPHTFSNSKMPVKLGKSTATAQGYETYNIFNTVEFTGVDIYSRFDDSFLDYSPYTEYELYIPFCGTVKLNAGDIIGHTLNCRLQIDLLTGACTAYIMADDLVIETTSGTCACELQITGTDTVYMNSAITNAITTARNAKTQKETADLSTISPAGLFSAVANPWKAAGEKTTAETNLYQADYNLQHIQTPVHSMGTASALTGWYQEFNARLIIYYPTGDAITDSIPPKLADLTTYAHTTGFATVENGVIGNYSGLTVATNPILNFAATATEKDMISAALQGGVFI